MRGKGREYWTKTQGERYRKIEKQKGRCKIERKSE
jgi:hypothetical protein